MAFASRVSYTGSTSPGPYSFASIQLFDDSIVPLQSQLVVTITGATQTYTSGIPVAGEYSMDKGLRTITLGSAPSGGDIIKVSRSTSSTAYVDFTNNSPLTAADLDIATSQSLYLAEESNEAIEAGDAVLALPELTNVDSTMAPANGDFLRWSDADAEWVSQAYVADGTGPDVNITTSFPASPAAGDLIYHSVYGATYIYTGTEWSIMCGTGATASVAPGTTVSELTFTDDGLFDAMTITAGWSPLLPFASPSAAGTSDPGLYGGCMNFWGTSNSTGSDYSLMNGLTDPSFDFGKAWMGSSVSVGGSGEMIFDNAAYAAEVVGNDVADNTFWGGASEANAATAATAVLFPRVDKAAMDADTGFTSGSTNSYLNILWYYPAGINWGAQDWRVTAKFVGTGPGWAGSGTDKFAAMGFIPEGFTQFQKDANDIRTGFSVDSSNLVAKGMSRSEIAESAIKPPLFSVGQPCTGTGTTSYSIVPGPTLSGVAPGSNPTSDWFANINDQSGPWLPAGTTNTNVAFQLVAAGQLASDTATQSSINGSASMVDKTISYTVTISFDAIAGVVTMSTTPDSVLGFTQGIPGIDGGLTISSDPAYGSEYKRALSAMDTGFFFNHGANGSYASAAAGSYPDGLVSIKIETL